MTEPGAPKAPLPPGWQVVHWHPEAPPKPPEGAPCNGCGLCCLAEPCPLGMLALAAIRTRRPVRYVFTREESFLASAKRHPFSIRYTMGLKRDGHITATKMVMVSDGGAYGMSTPGVMNKSAILGPGPYAVPHVWVDAIGVYTNNTPSGAMRAFGAFQSEFATEAHLDLCAERLGMDPVALRLINLMRDGATTHTRQPLDRVLAVDCLQAVVQAAGWDVGVPHRQGQGLPARTDTGGPGTRAPCTLGGTREAPAAPPPERPVPAQQEQP